MNLLGTILVSCRMPTIPKLATWGTCLTCILVTGHAGFARAYLEASCMSAFSSSHLLLPHHGRGLLSEWHQQLHSNCTDTFAWERYVYYIHTCTDRQNTEDSRNTMIRILKAAATLWLWYAKETRDRIMSMKKMLWIRYEIRDSQIHVNYCRAAALTESCLLL